MTGSLTVSLILSTSKVLEVLCLCHYQIWKPVRKVRILFRHPVFMSVHRPSNYSPPATLSAISRRNHIHHPPWQWQWESGCHHPPSNPPALLLTIIDVTHLCPPPSSSAHSHPRNITVAFPLPQHCRPQILGRWLLRIPNTSYNAYVFYCTH